MLPWRPGSPARGAGTASSLPPLGLCWTRSATSRLALVCPLLNLPHTGCPFRARRGATGSQTCLTLAPSNPPASALIPS